jgi:hypothetical protein
MKPLPANRVTRWARIMRRRQRSAQLCQLGRDLTLGCLFYCSIFLWFSEAKPGTYEARLFSQSLTVVERVASRITSATRRQDYPFEVYGN